MANGKVITGYSKPYVAKYTAVGSAVTYSNGMPLARGVDVEISVETADDNKFYADNAVAETAPAAFRSGTMKLTVDGLKDAARRLLEGLGEPQTVTVGERTVNVDDYGQSARPPYVGIGVIIRYQEDGVETYAPLVLTKARFPAQNTSAKTQGDNIEWQTQELNGSLHRDDTAAHNWKRLAEDQTSEEDAEAVLKALLNIPA